MTVTVDWLPSWCVSLTLACWPGWRLAKTWLSAVTSGVWVLLIAVMMSPALMPALAAGPPDLTELTKTPEPGNPPPIVTPR